jgi:hypothetical protein
MVIVHALYPLWKLILVYVSCWPHGQDSYSIELRHLLESKALELLLDFGIAEQHLEKFVGALLKADHVGVALQDHLYDCVIPTTKTYLISQKQKI